VHRSTVGNAPIVIIDSSLGGLCVVRHLRELLPAEPIVFFGDLARAPYSHRSPERVVQFVQQVICYLQQSIVPKHVLLTCDVASAVALAGARQQVMGGASVTGVLDPAARAAVEVTGTADRPIIGALAASNAVIESRALERALIRRRTRAKLVCRPAPLLQHIVEDGRAGDDPVLLAAAQQYLSLLLPRNVEVVLLASASLAPLRSQFASLAGKDIIVIDAARACAEDVARRLERSRLQLHPGTTHDADLSWYLTDESPAIFDRAERLAGILLPPPRIVSVEDLEHAAEQGRRVRIA
jgi:glutamate racemase